MDVPSQESSGPDSHSGGTYLQHRETDLQYRASFSSNALAAELQIILGLVTCMTQEIIQDDRLLMTPSPMQREKRNRQLMP